MAEGRLLTFSTPPSYSFDSTYKLWKTDAMKEQVSTMLRELLADNRQEKRQAHPFLCEVHMESAVNIIWLAVDMFKFSPQVKYIAIDLFRRFMLGHTENLLARLSSMTAEGHKRNRMLRLLEKRMKEQSPLWVITCVMLASKLVTHKGNLSAISAQKFLKRIEMNVHTSSIIRSERRILEQLDFRCYQNSSMLAYLGVVISVVGLWEGDGTHFTETIKSRTIKRVLPEDLFEMSVTMLDLVYLNYEKVYQQLYTSLTELPVIPDKHKAAFAHVLADRILLAGSVVASAAFVLGGQAICAAVISSITTHIHTPCKDIITMVSCILNCAKLPSNIKSLLVDV
ncbi:cyclin N-terminal domain-containing protein 1 [Procambarus clarkii]|uniref:cyclin N-terminal domain-containing protein 1 n=1 Tax=Procambarus clarkii TaxID=6728 RepID=UPI00374244BC